MNVGINQPYLFPYLGYFQLVNAVDTFVFYDDVNFIKKGWINRNRILIQGEAKLLTVPLSGASQNKHINEVLLLDDSKWKSNFLNTLSHNYKRAPFYDEIFSLVEQILIQDHSSISDLSKESVRAISNFLNIKTVFLSSSDKFAHTLTKDKADRLICISKALNADNYINAAGGKELYHKEYFASNDLNLFFISSNLPEYKQFKNSFVPGLSIIDVLMFNSKEEVIKMLDLYSLD